MIADHLDVNPEVADALGAGRPVVALESTLISHGLPYPQNLEVALASEAAVREADAVPATVAIRDGRLLVGLDEPSIEALATAPDGAVRKAARPSLAAALGAGGWAATTVSATMIAARAAGIDVFATGGIGGVHRGALASGAGTPSFDISSDLEELARTPMAVICAGPKAILDVPATLEYLETRGVSIVVVGQDEAARVLRPEPRGPARHRSPSTSSEAARLAAAHLGLGLGSAILICVPVPEADALLPKTARTAIDHAIADADAARIAGPALTPWLLSRIAELTFGASVRANTALIVNNARVGGILAARLRTTSQGGAPAR